MGSRFCLPESPPSLFTASALFAAAASLACSTPVASSPRATLAAFHQAYVARDVDGLWRLLSSAAHTQTSREELSRLLATATEEDIKEMNAALEGATKASITAEAGSPERPFALFWSDAESRWVLRAAPLLAFDSTTPRGALWALVHAVERHRWDVLLTLAPAARRRSLTVASIQSFWTGPKSAAIRALFPALRTALVAAAAHPVVDLGLEAHLPFAEHAEAFLVKEDGLWCVEEIEGPEVSRE